MSIAHRVLLQVHHRPRLVVAVVAGVLSLLVLPDHLERTTRGLLSWDLGVGLYLVLAFYHDAGVERGARAPAREPRG